VRPGRLAIAALAAIAPAIVPAAEDPTFAVRQLTPATALKAAQAALAKCRSEGYQVTVAVVDRAGLPQVLLRDRFAGPHTIDMATNKAWSAVSFKTNTSELEKITRPGEAMSALRNVPRATAIAGGVMIEAGGSLLGALGVSGAPGGDADEGCAIAGLHAIAEDLEF
jgi:uncharacterized protein GlcG (DUF336 family)